MIYQTSKKSFLHIFVCFTPLHCHLALSLSRYLNVEHDSLYMIVAEGDLKGFGKILDNLVKNEASHVILSCSNKFGPWSFLSKILKFECANLYLANPKKMISRLIIKNIKHKKLITYDDGFGNVSGAGYFYQDDFNVKKIAMKCLGFKSYSDLIDEVSAHYSIYPSLENVFSVTDYFHLNFDLYEVQEVKSKIDVAFIGSPLSEYNIIAREEEIIYITQLLSSYSGPVIYIKHPAESLSKIEKVKSYNKGLMVITLDDIAETFLIRNCKNISFVVGFYSTVLLHVINYFPGKVYAKKIPSKACEKIYEKLQLAGISVI